MSMGMSMSMSMSRSRSRSFVAWTTIRIKQGVKKMFLGPCPKSVTPCEQQLWLASLWRSWWWSWLWRWWWRWSKSDAYKSVHSDREKRCWKVHYLHYLHYLHASGRPGSELGSSATHFGRKFVRNENAKLYFSLLEIKRANQHFVFFSRIRIQFALKSSKSIWSTLYLKILSVGSFFLCHLFIQ